VAGGDVTLSGGGDVDELRIQSGTLHLAADLDAQWMTVIGDGLDSGTNHVHVGRRLIVGNVPITASAGGTIAVRGTVPDAGEAELTVVVDGGDLAVGEVPLPSEGLVSYWGLNDGAGSAMAADSISGNDGTLESLDANNAWIAGHTRLPGDYALQFQGLQDQHVAVGPAPSLQVTDQVTIAAWVHALSFSPAWAGIAGWVHDTGSTESGYCLCIYGGLSFGLKAEDTGYLYSAGGNPQLNTWHHVVGTYDGAMQRIYLDGELVFEQPATGAIDWDPLGDEDGFEIGRYNDDNEHLVLTGMIDDVMVYNRALNSGEVAQVYEFIPSPDEVVLPNTSLLVTGDTNLLLSSAVQGRPVLGDLTLDAGRTLTIPIVDPSFRDLSAGNGAKVDGSLEVRGTLAGEVAAAELTVEGGLRLTSDAVFAATVGAVAHDKIVAATDEGYVALGGASLEFQIDGNDPFTARTYTLIDVDPRSEDQITGMFAAVDGLGQYVSAGPNEDGIVKTDTTLTVTIDSDLNLGDANLDTKTNVLDFNEWNAHKFTTQTDWRSGDFNGDGKTNVLDFNVWNEHKFTAAEPGLLVEGQVPEPGTLLLLVGGLLGWLTMCRRRRAA
jgi:hypothetical protein